MSVEVRRLARFCAVGVLNTLLTLAAFAALVRLGSPAPAASALAFATGAVNGYLLNSRWTFRGSSSGPSTLVRYVAVQVFGAALSAAGVAMVSSDLTLRHLAAEVIVIPFVTVTTYSLSRRIVFDAPKVSAHR
jgi:putative flippase GtrA